MNMKKSFVFVVSLLVALPVWAQLPSDQSSPLTRIYEKYGDRSDVSSIYISAETFALISALTEDRDVNLRMKVNDMEVSRLFDVIDKLKGLFIISTEDPEDATSLYGDLSKVVEAKENKYIVLMKMKDGGEDVVFYYKSPDRKHVEEFLMLEATRRVSGTESPVTGFPVTSCSAIQFEADGLTIQDIAAIAAEMASDPDVS